MEAEHPRLEAYEDQILKCSECGFCQAQCPVFEFTLRPAYSTRGKLMVLKEVLRGDLELSHELADLYFTCTTCQACTFKCPSGVEGHEIVMAARRRISEAGILPESLKGVFTSISRSGNVFSAKPEERADIYPAEIRKKIPPRSAMEEASALLFMGCLPSYVDMKIVPSLLQVMEGSGACYTSLAEQEVCCGFPLYLTGSEHFEAHRARMTRKILSSEIREIITPCAGCYKAFATLYPGLKERGIQVNHSIQSMLQMIRQKKIVLKGRFTKSVTYHDPCDLGRGFGLYEEPREILRRVPGLNYVEMARNRADARCCGGGGALQAYKPDLASDMAARRVRDALEVGAEVIVSGCPACKDNLRKGVRSIPKAERGNIKVMDITEVVQAVIAP